MIATPIDSQMKTRPKTYSPHVPLPIPLTFVLHAATAVSVSEPPTHSGFVTQYNTAAIPPWKRPNASLVHSYGPPSIVNAEPTSAINSMYGATKRSAVRRSQRNPSGPFDATVPSVSRPTNAQTVKNTMSNRRSDLMSLLFSASAKAVVCSTTTAIESLQGSNE